jgi:hypothetical protein
MASPPVPPEIPGSFRFEFDPENKILLTRVEGCVTTELVQDLYPRSVSHWLATGARAGITDCSLVTSVQLSADFIRGIATRGIATRQSDRDSATYPRVIVASSTSGFGLGRMYQLAAEMKNPKLTVVRTMDEAFAALGVQSPRFEPLSVIVG